MLYGDDHDDDHDDGHHEGEFCDPETFDLKSALGWSAMESKEERVMWRSESCG